MRGESVRVGPPRCVRAPSHPVWTRLAPSIHRTIRGAPPHRSLLVPPCPRWVRGRTGLPHQRLEVGRCNCLLLSSQCLIASHWLWRRRKGRRGRERRRWHWRWRSAYWKAKREGIGVRNGGRSACEGDVLSFEEYTQLFQNWQGICCGSGRGCHSGRYVRTHTRRRPREWNSARCRRGCCARSAGSRSPHRPGIRRVDRSRLGLSLRGRSHRGSRGLEC